MPKLTKSSIILVCLVVCLLDIPAHADSPAAVRATISGLYHKEDVAADAKDPFGALACYDPNVQIFDKSGNQIGYSDQLQALQTSFQVAKSIHLQTGIVKFAMKGDDAVVTVKQVLSTVIIFPNSKKTLHITGTTTSRHLWSKDVDGWSITQARLLGRTFKLGKK